MRDVVRHVARVTESFADTVERGLAGGLERATDAERQARAAAFAALSDEALTVRFQAGAARFRDLLAALDERQLQLPAMHAFGQRPICWFISQELVELAIHRWDVDTALIGQARLEPDVARWLLPVVVEWNLGVLYSGSAGATLGIRSWTRSLPENAASDGPPQLTLTGDQASLCLFLYGRNRDLRQIEIAGDRALLSGFSGI